MKCAILPIVLLVALAAVSNAATKQPYIVSIYKVEMDSMTTPTASTTPSTVSTTPTTVSTTPTTVSTTPTTVSTTPTTVSTTPTTVSTTTPTTATTTPTTATTTPTTATTTPTTATTTPTTATTTPTTATTTPTTATTTPTTATTTPTTATTTPTTATTTPTTATTTPTTATTTPTTATTTPTTATTTPTTATTTPTTATTTPTTATTTPTTATTTPTTATTTPATATTTPTTATTTPVTATTTPATAASTAATSVKDYEVVHARHAREIKMAGHTYTPVCSGTIIGDNSVLTTITCAKLAVSTTGMAPAIRTAQYDSSNAVNTDMFYEVKEVIEHPGYDAVTKMNNVAILKLTSMFAMTGPEENKVNYIYWKTSAPVEGEACIGSYWTVNGAQSNTDMMVKNCNGAVNTEKICAVPATNTRVCGKGQDGAVLACNGEVAGLFYAANDAACDASPLVYQEVSKDKQWIWDTVNSAPAVHVSLASLLAITLLAVANQL